MVRWCTGGNEDFMKSVYQETERQSIRHFCNVIYDFSFPCGCAYRMGQLHPVCKGRNGAALLWRLGGLGIAGFGYHTVIK